MTSRLVAASRGRAPSHIVIDAGIGIVLPPHSLPSASPLVLNAPPAAAGGGGASSEGRTDVDAASASGATGATPAGGEARAFAAAVHTRRLILLPSVLIPELSGF
jgi:hypothetical protein